MKYCIACIVYRSLTPFAKSETEPRKVAASFTSLNVSTAFDHPHRALRQDPSCGAIRRTFYRNFTLCYSIEECMLMEVISGDAVYSTLT